MKKTEGQIIAQEVWNMIPDDAKVKMKWLKKPFMESIAADVDHIVNKISLNLPVMRSVCEHKNGYDVKCHLVYCPDCKTYYEDKQTDA